MWVDYSWATPDLTPFEGVLRYLPTGGARPDLTDAEISAHHADGRAVSPIWEHGQADALGGQAAGVASAKAANAAADSLGFPSDVAIFYTVDGDYTPSQVSSYVAGVRSVKGRPVGLYGSAQIVTWAASVGVPYRWQTAAWGNGVQPAAHLVQARFLPDRDESDTYHRWPAWGPKGTTPVVSNPMTYDELLNAVRNELQGTGIQLVEYPYSRDRCRCHNWDPRNPSNGASHDRNSQPSGKAWGATNGTIVHHTAGDAGARGPEQYIADILDSSSLPVACNFAVADDGTIYLVSAGRSNHDLMMSQAAYDALVNGTFSLDGYQDLRGQGVDPKAHFYGIENIAAGVPSDAQRRSSVLICAAISRAHGWNGRDCAGHGEVAADRAYEDPGLDMGAFRKDVMARVATGAVPTVTTTTTTTTATATPTPVQEDDMALPRIITALGPDDSVSSDDWPDLYTGDGRFVGLSSAEELHLAERYVAFAKNPADTRLYQSEVAGIKALLAKTS